METKILTFREHDYKRNMTPISIEPNITNSTIFLDNKGTVIGFYLKELPQKVQNVVNYCNQELRSDKVPKSVMQRRLPTGRKTPTGAWEYDTVEQESVIIGSVPAKAHQRRPYNTISSVHLTPSAQNFIKGMLLLCKLSEDLIKEFMPEQYEKQKKIIEENVLPKFRFGELFTSSISNYNIAANYHIDTKNLKETVNIIYSKKKDATGGNLHVPDYDLCFDNLDNSMICYPAWHSLHGVTPIIPTKKGGYRNSLVFYPLSGLTY